MGEIAEMMLDGTLCQYCGVAMVHGPNDEAAGYPVSCGCQDDDERWTDEDQIRVETCHLCGKKCRSEDGVLQHLHAKHPGWDAEPVVKATGGPA